MQRHLGEAHGALAGAHGVSHGSHDHGHAHEHVCKVDGCVEASMAHEWVAIAVAIMLFVLFLFNSAVLYFANYRDEHIRDNCYKMINTTVSIFAAVMLNSSVFSFLCEQIIPSPFPRGIDFAEVVPAILHHHSDANKLMYFTVGIFVLLSNFIAINVLCWHCKKYHHQVFAIESIWGHLCAFAGIYCFGNLMEVHWFAQTPWKALLVVLIALVVCVPVLFASRKWRDSRRDESDNASQQGLLQADGAAASAEDGPPCGRTQSGPASHAHHMEHWKHGAEEAENEAITLLTSFLLSQVVGFACIGKIPALHGFHLNNEELHRGTYISYAAILAAVVLVVGTLFLNRKDTRQRIAKADRRCQRFVFAMHKVAGMMLSWFLYRSLECHMLLAVPPELGVAHALAAFVALMASIVCILILDRFSDKVADMEDKSKGESPARSTSATSVGVAMDMAGAATGLVDTAADHVAHVAVHTAAATGLVDSAEEAQKNIEEGVRNLIKSIAIFVGLSWEKAFDMAEQTLVMSRHSSFLRLYIHPVLAKVGLACIVCVIMLPGWYYYLMPKALLTIQEHKERIKFDKAQETEKKE